MLGCLLLLGVEAGQEIFKWQGSLKDDDPSVIEGAQTMGASSVPEQTHVLVRAPQSAGVGLMPPFQTFISLLPLKTMHVHLISILQH